MDFSKIRFQMVWFSKGRAIALDIAMVPTILKTSIFLSRFQMFFDKMATIFMIKVEDMYTLVS